MPIMFWIWLGITAAAIIIEITTQDLVSVWFAAGGLVAMLMSISEKVPWYASAPVFLAVSLALLLSLRRMTKKYLTKSSEGKTNMDRMIGMKAHITSEGTFDKLANLVIGGITWNAKTADNDNISVGQLVEVLDVKGNTLIVKKIDKDIKEEE